MRKWNALISAAVIVLFLVHCVTGALQMFGFLEGGNPFLKILTYLMLALVVLHAAIGIALTAETLRLIRKSGASYLRGNELFWLRRISGGALVFLIAAHVFMLSLAGQNPVRLKPFEGPQLLLSLLLVLALLLHLLSNVRPLMIALGISGLRDFVKDLLIVLAVVLLLAGCAFAVYYLRWNIVWRP